ncbi:MAG: hypothetical protein WCG98_04560 [bacterium]
MEETNLESTNENDINPSIMDFQKNIEQKIREILVVEDTPESLAVAKKFYNSQNNLNVDYAMDRNTALSMLENKKYDGVITDRSLPRNEEESLKSGITIPSEKIEKYFELYSQNPIKIGSPGNSSYWGQTYDRNQGYLIAGTARLLKDIPVVIHSYHGASSEFWEILKTAEITESQKREIKIVFDQYSLPFEEMLETCGAIQGLEDFFSNQSGEDWGDKNSCNIKYKGTATGTTKKDSESWALALQYLKENIAKKIK